MKMPYSFAVLRYIHNIVTGEFINVGVVLYSPKARFLSALCTARYGRVSNLSAEFHGFTRGYLLLLLRI